MPANKNIVLSKRPTWIRPFILEGKEFPVLFNDKEYHCLTIDSLFGEVQGAPCIFAMNHPSGVFGISSEYPRQWRELAMLHEFMPHNEHVGSCLAALLNELELAEERGVSLSEYGDFRQRFFGDLVEYYENKPREPSEELLLAQLKLSHNFLLHEFDP